MSVRSMDIERASLNECDQLVPSWDRIIALQSNLSRGFQSVQWCRHLEVRDPDDRCSVLVARDQNGELAGVVPIVESQQELRSEVRHKALLKTTLNAVTILGGEPALPADAAALDTLLEAIGSQFPQADCISLPLLDVNSFCWRHLERSATVRKRYAAYRPGGITTIRSITLPGSFEEYLQKFTSKHRGNLKRQVRRLEEEVGPLELVCATDPEHVAKFLPGAAAVELKSWQTDKVEDRIRDNGRWNLILNDLAGRQSLRSYLLLAGGHPCAYVLGYVLANDFHYVQIGYDQDLKERSPGAVLLFLLIEDLIKSRVAERLSFGFGDTSYKEAFSNRSHNSVQAMLVRRRTFAQLSVLSHSSVEGTLQLLRATARRIARPKH